MSRVTLEEANLNAWHPTLGHLDKINGVAGYPSTSVKEPESKDRHYDWWQSRTASQKRFLRMACEILAALRIWGGV